MRVLRVRRRSTRERRPGIVRNWSGPLIGRDPETVDAYLARIERLVADERTQLYFDASFLMWLAKIGENARAEFLAWQSATSDSRFHVPLWAAHEFFKHRLKNTVTTELSREIKAFDSAATTLYEKLRVYCSDRLFGFKDSGLLFLDEYRRTVQPLRSMLKLAEGSDQYALSVKQVADYIDGHLLSGPMSGIIQDIDDDERVRNRGAVPPSFKDAHKRGGTRGESVGEQPSVAGDNSFGDLAFWREVLRHAVHVRAGAVLILTADRKNDWFENRHGDAGLTPEFRKVVVRPRPVPAPHPLLMREAFDRGAGDLALIDPMYCAVLIARGGKVTSNLAAAALDVHLPEPERKPNAARSWAGRFGAQARLLGEPPSIDGEEEAGEEPFDAASLDVVLLRPSHALPAPKAEVLRRIERGDLATQAEVLGGLDAEELGRWDVPSLVALGRVAFLIAEEGAASAAEFIYDLRDNSTEYPPGVREPLFFGALGSLYFDEKLEARPASGSGLAAVLLGSVTLPELRRAALAIGTALGGRRIFFRPGHAAPLKVTVVIQPSANNKAPADLVAIKLRGADLMTTLQTEEQLRFTAVLGLPAGEADIQVGALLDVLARFHLLPKQLIQTETNVDLTVRVPEFAGVELDV